MVVLLVVLSGTSGGALAQQEGKKAVLAVARVNGAPISVEELSMWMRWQRAAVRQHFDQRYDTAGDNVFWRRTYGSDAVPLERLKAQALEALVQAKVEQLLMQRHGLWPDVRYAAFRRQLKKTNQQRRRAHERGAVVYGPVAYRERAFLEHLMATRRLRLQRRFAETGGPRTHGGSPGRERLSSREDPHYEKRYERLLDRLVHEARVAVDSSRYRRLGERSLH